MASRTSCFIVMLGLLAGSSRAAYLGSPNQGPNGFPSGGHGGAGGGGVNTNGGVNGGGFNNNGGVNGGGFNNNGGTYGGNGANGGGDPIANLANVIPGDGVPGQDYPILASVPDTGFVCQGRIPGYYADTNQQAGCQVFHICQEDDRMDSFLCPNGTIFNQQYFVCDWWFNFDCSTAEQFYGLNANIGQVNGNGNGIGNGDGNGYGTGNGNGFGNRNGGTGTSSGLSNSYGAPGTGGVNGGTSAGTGSTGGVSGGNGNGGSPQGPSGLYQAPN
ncbi:uncharacterized protein [Palaemon carinicauda]|uniref:uncharacterized protein n=1 Tax=Palaemon carinicauda TaxID=392227 RepID=UPI0035B600CB